MNINLKGLADLPRHERGAAVLHAVGLVDEMLRELMALYVDEVTAKRLSAAEAATLIAAQEARLAADVAEIRAALIALVPVPDHPLDAVH